MSYLNREWYACLMALSWAVTHRPALEIVEAAHGRLARHAALNDKEAKVLESDPAGWVLSLHPDERARLIGYLEEQYGEPANAHAQEAATEMSRSSEKGIVQ